MPDTVLLVVTWGLRAAAVLLLLAIAIGDFRTRKIRNEQLLRLLAVAVAMLVVDALRTQSWQSSLIGIGMSVALFVVLFLFWLGGKVGAGDVKLLGILPMLVGFNAMLPMAIAMLAFSLLTYVLLRYPTLMPERLFRSYIQSMDETGRVPFGVPISAAAIVVLLFSPVSG